MAERVLRGLRVAGSVVLLRNFCPILRYSITLTCVFSPDQVAAYRQVTSMVIMVPEVVEGVAGAVVGVGEKVSLGVGGFGGGGVSEAAGEFQDVQAGGEGGLRMSWS